MPRASVILVVAIALYVIGYAPTQLATEFVYEDDVYIGAVQAPLETSQLWRARGLSFLSYRMDAMAFSGDSPRPYHATNVVLHLVAGLLVYWLGRRLMRRDDLAALAAALFLVHPLNAEAVAYVAGRPEILAAIGVLGALILATYGPLTLARAAGIVLLLAVGVWGKESAIAGVFLVGLYYAIVQPYWAPRLRTVLLAGAALALAVGPIVIPRVLMNPYVGESERNGLGYMAMQSAALVRHLALVVWPSGFTIDHDFELVSKGLAFAALGALVISVCALWAMRDRARVLVCAALWIVAAVAPRFVVRIPEYLNEHQMYLAMVGVCLAIPLACARWLPAPTWLIGEDTREVWYNAPRPRPHTEGAFHA